ncbi:MAG: hypothetical protein IJF92_00640 [Bacilli bacterium]|nr:hypothetical protein [Bacilli bacterium]MBQ3307679.1 hypothetical protein [Bacilli bacterium]
MIFNKFREGKVTKNYYYFNSISDLSQYIEDNKNKIEKSGISYSTTSHGNDPENRGQYSWHGSMTFKEAFDKLVNGDIDLANKIEDIDIGNKVDVEKIAQKYVNDIVGVIPHVPNSIIGVPQSMIDIRRTRVRTNNKIIDLIIDSSVHCGITAEDYIRVSKLFLNIVDKIEKIGYRCNIYYSITNYDDYYRTYYNNWLLKLKGSEEPFNKYKCAFVIGSLAMFRRIGFRLIELGDSSRADKGEYGCLAANKTTINLINDNLKISMILSKNPKIIRLYDMLNETEESVIKNIVDINQNEHR